MKDFINDQMDRLTIYTIAQGLNNILGRTEPKRAERAEDVVNLGHLKWLLNKIEENYETWPLGKLGRWTGIVMGCLACHGFKVTEIQKIVADAKTAYGEGVDVDLKDHLDENDPFIFDIGGGD